MIWRRKAVRRVATAKARQPGKALAARGGWVFLVNDTNDFLPWQFGVTRWTRRERAQVAAILKARLEALAPTPYLMFITPEKSVAYQEYLPKGLVDLNSDPSRPATWLAKRFPAQIHYLQPWFERMKRLGFLYFRGDTHVNWLGGYLLYRFVIETLDAAGLTTRPAITSSELLPARAGFEGDLFVQLDENQKPGFDIDADYARWRAMLEITLKYNLDEALVRAKRLALTPEDQTGFHGREMLIYETPDPSLPRAVVFRDSTATESIPFLAEHFSRSVYVWHDGDVLAEIIRREQPDIVLHFVAERFLATYPTTVPLNFAAP